MMRTWIKGDNGNRASVELWGGEDAARNALATLKYCSDCSRCSDCSDSENLAPAEWPASAVPVIEDIHRKVLAAASNPGALDMGSFHVCDTTHCRAGWVVHLAGEAGYALERQTSSVFAAMQIYKASGYEIAPTRFFESNEIAMADMKRLANVMD